jgi:hypothetical protein
VKLRLFNGFSADEAAGSLQRILSFSLRIEPDIKKEEAKAFFTSLLCFMATIILL